MLDVGSFFRRVPAGLALEQRLLIDAMAFSIDAVYTSYDAMRARAALIGIPDKGMDHGNLVYLTMQARAVIDHGDMLVQLLSSFLREYTLEVTGEFEHVAMDIEIIQFLRNYCGKWQTLRDSRNFFAHINGNLAKLSAIDRATPVHGSLSYIHFRGNGEDKLPKASIITICAGALSHDKYSASSANPCGKEIEYPVGMFEFHSFGRRIRDRQSINLSDFFFDTQSVVQKFDNEIQEHITQQLKIYAREQGHEEEKILGRRASGLTVVMDIEFQET